MKPLSVIYALLLYSYASAETFTISSAVYSNEKLLSYSCLAVTDAKSQIESHSSIVVIEMKKGSKVPEFHRNPDSSVTIHFNERDFKLTDDSSIVFIDPESGVVRPISEVFLFNDSSEFFELHWKMKEIISDYLNK